MHGFGCLSLNARGFGVGLNKLFENKLRHGAGALASDAFIAAGLGGVAAYAYAWTKVSGDAITITSAAAASTTFSYTFPAAPFIVSAQFVCTVTDATGLAQASAVVSVTLSCTLA